MFLSRGNRSFVAAAFGLALGSAALQAGATNFTPPAPVQFDGRYYQVVIANKISWEAAKAAAEQRTFQGVQGHLATIGSPEEDAFVHQLRQQVLSKPHPSLTGTELWVGGYQVQCATTTPEPGCGWLWLNGESISPTNTAIAVHELAERRAEQSEAEAGHLSAAPPRIISRSATTAASAGTTKAALTNVWGYIIEYGDEVTVPASTCTAEAGGCNPTGAQILQLPATAELAPDATLTARVTTIHDDPNRCGKQPLTLFNGAVVIPPYLCGHPDFIVIETHTEGVEVLTGAVEVENLTEEVLPGNLYGCTPVRQNPAGVVDPDPSHRDVVGWQAQDPQRDAGDLARQRPLLRHGRGSDLRLRQLARQGRERLVSLRRPAHSPGAGQRADGRQPARQSPELHRPDALQAGAAARLGR